MASFSFNRLAESFSDIGTRFRGTFRHGFRWSESSSQRWAPRMQGAFRAARSLNADIGFVPSASLFRKTVPHGKFRTREPPTEVCMWPGDDNPEWWPPHVQAILAAIGQAMGDKRLHPDTLKSIPSGFGSILRDHQVIVEHLSMKEFGSRKNRYRITVEGPVFGGQWGFRSGDLEKLSRAAAVMKRSPTD